MRTVAPPDVLRWIRRAAYLLVAAAWVAARSSVFMSASAIEFPDSPSYHEKAAAPLDSDFFFGAGRFFVVPLVYKITIAAVGPGSAWLTTAQLGLSIVAWLALAWSFSRTLSGKWLGWLGFVAVLAFGLSEDVILWDRAILSESMSISGFALLIAALLRLAEGVTRPRIAALLGASIAWSWTRETNSLFLLAVAAALACWAAWYLRNNRRQQRGCAVAAVTCLFLAVTTNAVSSRGERWVFPLLNVIGQRVLPSPERTAYYASHGMPVNLRLRAMSGEFAAGQNWAFYTAPELEDFRRWLRSDGRRVYALDLASHPVRTLLEPRHDVHQFVCPRFAIYRPAGFTPVLPQLGHGLVCGHRQGQVIIVGSLLVGLGSAIAAAVLRRRISSKTGFILLLGASLLLSWVPIVWFTWQVIGGMEIARHVLGGTLMLRLGMLPVTASAALLIRERVQRPGVRAAAFQQTRSTGA